MNKNINFHIFLRKYMEISNIIFSNYIHISGDCMVLLEKNTNLRYNNEKLLLIQGDYYYGIDYPDSFLPCSLNMHYS